jgi:hypothetical protein
MLYASSSSCSCQQYLVYSSSDILKSMQQLNGLNKVQITQDKNHGIATFLWTLLTP